jgi:hypothetical protein
LDHIIMIYSNDSLSNVQQELAEAYRKTLPGTHKVDVVPDYQACIKPPFIDRFLYDAFLFIYAF